VLNAKDERKLPADDGRKTRSAGGEAKKPARGPVGKGQRTGSAR
jgi:hypothetical protein